MRPSRPSTPPPQPGRPSFADEHGWGWDAIRERISARLEVIAGHLLHEYFKHGGHVLHAPVFLGHRRRAHQSECRGLAEIEQEHLTGPDSQGSEDGDRVYSARNPGAHRLRYTDPADQQ